MTTEAKSGFTPKLYLYFHCPYCVRPQLVLGLKHIAHELVFLDHHDEKAHIDKIGAKQVPILEYEEGKFMKESLDIVKYLDETKSLGDPVLKTIPAGSDAVSKAIEEFEIPSTL